MKCPACHEEFIKLVDNKPICVGCNKPPSQCEC